MYLFDFNFLHILRGEGSISTVKPEWQTGIYMKEKSYFISTHMVASPKNCRKLQKYKFLMQK